MRHVRNMKNQYIIRTDGLIDLLLVGVVSGPASTSPLEIIDLVSPSTDRRRGKIGKIGKV